MQKFLKKLLVPCYLMCRIVCVCWNQVFLYLIFLICKTQAPPVGYGVSCMIKTSERNVTDTPCTTAGGF